MGFGRPKRIRELAPEGSSLARALTSARARQPTPAEKGALGATLLATLGSGAAAAAATPATAAAKASMSAASATPVAVSIAMKATLLLALGVGAGAGGARWLRRHEGGAPPSRHPATQAPEVARDPEPPAPTGDEVPAPVAPASLPVAVERSRRASRLRAIDRREPAPAIPDITAELKLIERARGALAADPARALKLCEVHAHTYARGVMGEERDVMTITALASLDRVSEARAALESFRRRYPASPHATRLAERLRLSSAPR